MKVKISAPDAAGDTAQLGSNIEDAGSVHPPESTNGGSRAPKMMNPKGKGGFWL